MRVGDLPPHDADHVGLAGGDSGVCAFGCADVAFGLHPRVVNDFLQSLCQRRPQFIGKLESGHQLRKVKVSARAAADVVDHFALIKPCRDIAQGIQLQGHWGGGIDAGVEPDDEVVAHCKPNALNDFGGKAQAVF